MTVLAQNNFDKVDSVVGSLPPGWANVDGTWAVGTTAPVSGTHTFGSTTKGSLDVAIFSATGAPSAVADMGITFDQVMSAVTSTTASVCPVVRSTADGQTFYTALFSWTSGYLGILPYKRAAGSYVSLGSGTTTGILTTTGDTLHARLECIGTTINVYASLNGTALPTTPTFTFTDSAITAAGYCGLLNSTAPSSTPTTGIDNFVLDNGMRGTPITAGTANAGATTATTAAATASVPTGGGGSFTYQWYRSTSSGALGSTVSGQTSTGLSDTGLTTGTSYYYTLKQTDVNGDFVYTNQITETTAGPATAYTLTGPTTGPVGSASSAFTLTPNGTPSTSLVVTIATSTGATPSSSTFTFTTNAAQTFTVTAATSGAKAITATHTGGGFSGDPSTLTYIASTGLKYNRVDATDTRTGQAIMVLVPNSNSAAPYAPGTPTGVILYAHGAGEDQQGLLTDTLKAGCVDALLDAGYILASTIAHDLHNWGNQPSVDDYAALGQYVKANYSVLGICMWGQSMGGLDSLLTIAQGKLKGIRGWLGTYPVCNLASVYAIGTYAGNINTAYGITNSGIYTYANQTYGHDPVLMDALSFHNVPMRFYASPGDTVVPKASNTDQFKALITSSTRESAVVACTGNHGDPSHFIPAEYVAFFRRCFANAVATSGLPFILPVTTKTITVPIKDAAGNAVLDATGIKWKWFDTSDPSSMQPPSDAGSTAAFVGGNLTLSVHTLLSTGGLGTLDLSTSDSTATQSPPPSIGLRVVAVP